MIAGFWSFPLKPGAFDSFQEFFNQNAHSLLTSAAGFKRLASYYDPNSNQIVMVLEWESEEAAASLRENPVFPTVMSALSRFLTAAPTRALYQIIQDQRPA